MMLGMQLLEPFACHMGIDLRGGNIRMPQQQLHHAQISTMIDQMRGKSMSQHVWADGWQALLPGIAGNQMPGHLPRHAGFALGDEHRVARQAGQQQRPPAIALRDTDRVPGAQ